VGNLAIGPTLVLIRMVEEGGRTVEGKHRVAEVVEEVVEMTVKLATLG